MAKILSLIFNPEEPNFPFELGASDGGVTPEWLRSLDNLCKAFFWSPGGPKRRHGGSLRTVTHRKRTSSHSHLSDFTVDFIPLPVASRSSQ